MKAYVIVESNILDTEKLAKYSKQAAATLQKFGGKFIAKGSIESLHGNRQYSNKAILEFGSMQQAKDWYQSNDYQALIELRNQAMESQFQLVEAIQLSGKP